MNPRVIVALDYDRREDAEQFVSLVKPEDCLLKVALEMRKPRPVFRRPEIICLPRFVFRKVAV